jgi:hypothetical protein
LPAKPLASRVSQAGIATSEKRKDLYIQYKTCESIIEEYKSTNICLQMEEAGEEK